MSDQQTNQPSIDLTETNNTNKGLLGTLFNRYADLGFRLGLGFLLLINSIVAFTEPDSFKSLLEVNIIGKHISESLLEIMVFFAGVNDLLLAGLVVFGKWKKLVLLWVGLWFAVIAGVKAMNLIW